MKQNATQGQTTEILYREPTRKEMRKTNNVFTHVFISLLLLIFTLFICTKYIHSSSYENIDHVQLATNTSDKGDVK